VNIVRSLFNEKNDELSNAQQDVDTIEVVPLTEVVSRIRASEEGSASAYLREQLLLRAPDLAEDVRAENCIELALAAALTDNPAYQEAVIVFLQDRNEFEPVLLFHLNELLGDTAIFAEVMSVKRKALAEKLSHLADALQALSTAARAPATHEAATLSRDVILLSLYLDAQAHSAAYEQGVEQLLKVLDRFGRFGELNEGLAHAQTTIDAVSLATRAMMLHGDERAFAHASWLHMSGWLIHLLQPGRMAVNYGDARGVARQPRKGSSLANSLAGIAWLRQDAIALWALKQQFDGYPPTIAGYCASLYDGLETTFEPAPYGYFPQAGLLVWRNGWADDSSGLWIRGGHPADIHDHQDRGHLSFTLNGKPIVWECGMPPVTGDARESEYRSFLAHNVLAIDFDEPLRASAPLIVRLLDENRGNVRIDGSKCYPALARWNRDVFWRANREVRIIDDLTFKIGERGSVAFRWHLADTQPVDLVRNQRRFIVESEHAAIIIQADEPILVSQSVANDYSLSNSQQHSHVVLLVESIGRPTKLRVMTRIVPKSEDSAR